MSLSNIFKLNDTVEGSENTYVVLKKLGNGGSGAAYLTMSTKGKHTGCYFVIKFFYQLEKEDRLKRFRKEIEFLSKSSHPSIIKFYEQGEHTYCDKKCPFYVMDYMPQTLDSLLCNGKLTLEKAFLYTTQLLSALNYIQSQNIVHRDIKPENIFINGNHAILGDFGLIKDLSIKDENVDSDIQDLFSSISEGDAMPFNYRTPQLVSYMKKDKPLSLKSDIFQLGITIMRMFTGEHPLDKCKHKSDPIKFKKPLNERYNSLRNIKHGHYIIDILDGMLNEDEDKILKPEDLLNKSTLTFRNFLKEENKLEGQILI